MGQMKKIAEEAQRVIDEYLSGPVTLADLQKAMDKMSTYRPRDFWPRVYGDSMSSILKSACKHVAVDNGFRRSECKLCRCKMEFVDMQWRAAD